MSCARARGVRQKVPLSLSLPLSLSPSYAKQGRAHAENNKFSLAFCLCFSSVRIYIRARTLREIDYRFEIRQARSLGRHYARRGSIPFVSNDSPRERERERGREENRVGYF